MVEYKRLYDSALAAGLKWRLATLRIALRHLPRLIWRPGPPLRNPERSRGRLGTSRGASKPALSHPQNDDFHAFNQVRLHAWQAWDRAILLAYPHTLLLY